MHQYIVILISVLFLNLLRCDSWKVSSPASKLSRDISKIAGKGIITAAVGISLASSAFATTQEDSYIDSLKVLFMSKKLIEPINSFTLAQKYDQARSKFIYLFIICQLLIHEFICLYLH